jgi:flagellar assembly protein FliH
MTTSAENQVLRGAEATALPAARLDTDLRKHNFLLRGHSDARLADPTLERAFAQVAAEVRKASAAEGYAVGWAEGLRAATERVEAMAMQAEEARQAAADAQALAVRTSLHALADAARSLETHAVAPALELRDLLLQAATQLAETLLGRELETVAEPGMDAVRRALDLVPAGRPVTLRMHPIDASVVRQALAEMAPGELGRDVLVVADPAVEEAGCVAQCDAMRVDAQLSTALARVREVISS